MKFTLYHEGKPVQDQVLLEKFSTEQIGVFETMRTYHGQFFRLEEHLQRLQASAKTAGFEKNLDLKRVRKELETLLKKLGPVNISVRLTLVQDEILMMAGERKHSRELYQSGVALRTSPVKRSHSNAASPEIKTTDYTNAVMATLEPGAPDVYEWLFLDGNGFVTEVRIGNLFIVKKALKAKQPAVILTPPLRGILNGVTRRFVIECAHLEGLEVREVPLTRHEIYNADEAFLTNTSWEILPVRELDGRKIGGQIPGIITQKLHKNFKKRVEQECPNPLSEKH